MGYRLKLPGRRLRAFRSAFTPDGRRLVTAHVTENVAVVWDLAAAINVGSWRSSWCSNLAGLGSWRG